MEQDSVVYEAYFGAVLPAKGLSIFSVEDGLDCLGLCYQDLRRRALLSAVLNLMRVLPDAHPARTFFPGDLDRHVRGLSASEGIQMFVHTLSGRSDLSLFLVYAMVACTYSARPLRPTIVFGVRGVGLYRMSCLFKDGKGALQTPSAHCIPHDVRSR